MIRNRTYLLFFRQFFDYLMILMSFLLAVYLTKNPLEVIFSFSSNEVLLLLLLLIAWFVSANATKLYEEFRSRNFTYELIIVLRSILGQFVVSIVLIFLIKEIPYSRLFVFYYIFNLFLLLFLEKYFFRRILIWLRRKGRNLRTILIIGAGKVGKRFYETVKDSPHFGYKVIGFLDDFEIPMSNGLYLGPINNLENVILNKDIDNVIVTLPNYATERIQEVINLCELNGKEVRIIPDYFRFSSSKFSLSMFGPFPVVAVKNEKIDQLVWRLIKRLFDLSFSIIVMIFILSWLFPLVGLFIKLDSKGPIIFKQERWGRGNRKFLLYKFRSMCSNSSDTDLNGKYQQAQPDDPRLTRFGKILRKTNLDEFLQFINVLKGEMSVVGPRPHPTPLNIESRERISNYLMRNFVKPGVTGWAQVNGLRGETSDIKQMEKRVEYDLWYINNWSILLDIQIILMTIWYMIKGDPNAY